MESTKTIIEFINEINKFSKIENDDEIDILPFCYTYMIGKENDKGEIKKDFDKSAIQIMNNSKQSILTNSKYDWLIISLNQPTGYYIFDTDNEDAFNILESILNDNQIETMKTPSFKNVQYGYKHCNHYWFKVDMNEFKHLKLAVDLAGIKGLDVRFFNGDKKGLIFENKNSKIGFEPYELPLRLYDRIFEQLKEFSPKKNVINKLFDEYIEEREILKEEKKEEKRIRKEKKAKKQEKLITLHETNGDKSNFTDEQYEEMYSVLKPEFMKNYDDFLRFAFIAVNEDHPLKYFDKYCKRCEGYDKENNKKIIEGIKNDLESGKKSNKKLTNGTFLYYVKMSDKDLFNKLVGGSRQFWELMRCFTDCELMRYFHVMNNYNKFVFQPYEKLGSWYRYEDNNIISNVGTNPSGFMNEIKEYITEQIINQIDILNKDRDNKYYKDNIKLLKENLKRASSHAFLKSTVEYYKEFITNKEFEEIMDKNNNILTFKNQTFDRSIHNFRPLQKDDYASIFLKYNLEFIRNKKANEYIYSVLNKIFKDPKTRDYWLLSIAYSIFPSNIQKLFIWSGRGRNGKSLLADFLGFVFGDYTTTVEDSFLVGESKSNYDSNLASCKNKRIVICSEPQDDNNNGTIKTSYIKKITGESKIKTREIYKSVFEMNINFVPFLLCNDKPRLKSVDKSITDRIIDIPFLTYFTDSPKYELGEELKDAKLKEKLFTNENRNEFLFIILDVLKNTTWEEIDKLPSQIKESTDEYFASNNELLSFVNENLVITQNQNDLINSTDLYRFYKENKEEGTLELSQKAFSLCLTKYFNVGKSKNGKIFFTGLKMKN